MRKLSVEEKKFLCWQDSIEGFEWIAEQRVSEDRWMSHNWAVFKEEGSPQLWALKFALGLTECQENEFPCENEEPFKVWKVERTEYVYVEEYD